MTASSQIDALPVNAETGSKPLAWWGTWMFIATEAMLFAVLLASYFFIRYGSEEWPQGGIEAPPLSLPILGTVLLLTSSATAHWAEQGARRGRLTQLRAGLGMTVLLGLGFMATLVVEYAHSPFLPTANAYASLFFGVTGFHGLHVLGGLAMLLAVGLVAWRTDAYGPTRHLPVRLSVIYWHFVDVVWVFVFVTVYLSPRWP